MKIIVPSTAEELKMYYDLRYEMLRKPWNRPYKSTIDEDEDSSVHALMLDDSGKAVAAGRLVLNSDEEGQVRSMAVTEEMQGKGLGTKILQHLEDEARKKKFKHIVLDAREGAINFYKKNGYTPEGDSYILFGVIPHVRMKKTL
jgi:predicted GNAT family N-acyltransferase